MNTEYSITGGVDLTKLPPEQFSALKGLIENELKGDEIKPVYRVRELFNDTHLGGHIVPMGTVVFKDGEDRTWGITPDGFVTWQG